MNFYNPYYYTVPMSYAQNSGSLFGRLFGRTGISISNFLNGTQRILNIANQTIPLVKQVKPMIGNAKTMFKVMNEFKRVEKPLTKTENIDNNISNEKINQEKQIETSNTNGPIFFA